MKVESGKQPELTGIITYKELCAYYRVSDKTMKKKLEPLQLFLKKSGSRKRTYDPFEWTFIIDQLGDHYRR